MLTPIKLVCKDDKYRQYWEYLCSCGNTKIIHKSSVVSGNTKSCGCLRGKSRKLQNDQGTINQIILQYKRHAKNRGIKWKLSDKIAEHLFRSPCFYCGNLHGNLKKTKNNKQGFLHNGIDRVDNDKPYEKNNVVSSCGFCNRAKNTLHLTNFLEWIEMVYEYRVKNSGVK